ncbi:MAG TPA: nuclear transport factor 2 family protein [Pyrinomonadaceae bacterium]|jgi:ketosteroid isomerase-like protein|nr:nuclear transport factor 2 family protein [Pyrinomonadaceae bacterium]
MKMRLSLIAVLLVLVCGGLSFFAIRTSAEPQQQTVANQIIAREKAAYDAWQRKDKAFYADYLADDATYFGPMHPYLETDPKENFLPKLDRYTEMFKYLDFQMYNPRVQVYGDTAILTYNSAVSVNVNGRPMNYTAKMTSVYVKQGDKWRVVHGHESMNPGAN